MPQGCLPIRQVCPCARQWLCISGSFGNSIFDRLQRAAEDAQVRGYSITLHSGLAVVEIGARILQE